MFIKNSQREFKEKFGEELIVDFSAMNKIDQIFEWSEEEIDELLDKSVSRFGADKKSITHGDTRLHANIRGKEREAVIEFCAKVKEYNIDTTRAAKVLGKDRAIISYYNNYRVTRKKINEKI